MSDIAAAAPAATDHPFVKMLASLVRAADSHGVWERKSDAEVLAEFVVSREERRARPIIDDPDPDIIDRVEAFYGAVGLAVEQATGRVASPILKLNHEGFGRVLLTAGRLVVISKTLRDVHRFGFDDFAALATAGGKMVDEATAMIGRFPEVADL
ncbi:NifX-associated nitrogen fixation protein [Pleomorphomonas sp. PLEO]|uniref:NifX-associated nitrogen fixation protein n=1 Tax=Pleomorphomonas sp. PLEO TaxID=3239306 RepID=UPI00351EC8BC